MSGSALWPWLAVAAAGALHGLNPAGGWVIAAACGARSGDRSQALRALLPIACGHAVSVTLVAAALAAGLVHYRGWMLAGAALGLAMVLAWRKRRATASLALGAFVVSTVHGAGLMLAPALASLCLAGTPGRPLLASGSMGIGLAVVGVHMAAMLGATAVLALATQRIAMPAARRLTRRLEKNEGGHRPPSGPAKRRATSDTAAT